MPKVQVSEESHTHNASSQEYHRNGHVRVNISSILRVGSALSQRKGHLKIKTKFELRATDTSKGGKATASVRAERKQACESEQVHQ